MTEFYDVAVLGGGPSGMAAALAAHEKGAETIIIEREERLGGILKQCVHDGFGLISTGKKMAGPEYAQLYVDKVAGSGISTALRSFVSKIEKTDDGLLLNIVSAKGLRKICAKALVLATGCRERTARQVFIHGDRPAGVYTAGSAQNYVNIKGMMPGKRIVILGSGDIGLIMARRLTLEGAEVLGVYEAKSSPGGLPRNLSQCLDDFNIPLHLSHTVTRVIGRNRVEAVETAKVDNNMRPIPGTEEIIPCDCLILSVGLIPENELAQSMGIRLDKKTMGPYCDQKYETEADGVFSCGNALHVNDLVDFVSRSGKLAGEKAAEHALNGRKERRIVEIRGENTFGYFVPQLLDLSAPLNNIEMYFRCAADMEQSELSIELDGKEIYHKNYSRLRPPEMERLKLDFSSFNITENSKIELKLREAGSNG